MLTIILLVGAIIIVSGLIITKKKNIINPIYKFIIRRIIHNRRRFITLPKKISLVVLGFLKINIVDKITHFWKRFSFPALSCFTALLILTQLLFFSNVAYAEDPICGVPGKDSPYTPLGVINTYYPGTAATASSGATSISVGAAKGATTPITAGDLLLVIQMQDASINTTNTDAYGDGVAGGNASGWTSLRTAGSYQYVVATNSVPLSGGTVNLAQALTLTYTNANATATDGQRRYQVIRVPQYSSAIITNTVTSYAWDGAIGGVVAADVAGSLTFSGAGTIDVSGQGFRGGGGTNLGGDGTTGAASQNSAYVHPAPLVTGIGVSPAPTGTNNYDGSKGEGIAGTPRYTRNGGYPPVTGVTDNLVEGYANGSFSRGAPANAGGGGTDPNKGQNSANTGGGGGANAGAGGKGGDSWTDNSFSTNREPFGGYGGTAVSPSVNLIFLGGGGGAGTSNNSTSGNVPSGGGGGGMVIIRSGQVLGTGSITADGIQGVKPASTDGGGGGGAGGTVLIQSVTPSTASISISAKGGPGLDSGYNDHGPGGGGGGGYIAYQGFTPTVDVSGAASGNDIAGTQGPVSSTHNAAADPYGASPGLPGTAISTAIPAAQVKPGASCLPLLTVTKTTSTPTILRPTPVNTTATYTISVANDSTRGDALNVNISDTLPTNFTYASTTSITLTGGATRPTTTNPTVGATNPTWGTFIIPPSGRVQIVFNTTVAAAAALQTYQNPATATYIDPTRTSAAATTSSSYNPASSTGEDVTLTAGLPNLLLVKRITSLNGVDIPNFVDDTAGSTATYDNDPNWPTPKDTYLRGAINLTNIKPSDQLEYTIYFLSNGNADATNVTLCDLVPSNTTFAKTAFNNLTPIDAGSIGSLSDRGLALANSSSSLPATPTVYMSNVDDGDRGYYYEPGTTPPSTCKLESTPGSGNYIPMTAADNSNGLVVVNVARKADNAKLPKATGSGTPPDSYGFIRFRAIVK